MQLGTAGASKSPAALIDAGMQARNVGVTAKRVYDRGSVLVEKFYGHTDVQSGKSVRLKFMSFCIEWVLPTD